MPRRAKWASRLEEILSIFSGGKELRLKDVHERFSKMGITTDVSHTWRILKKLEQLRLIERRGKYYRLAMGGAWCVLWDYVSSLQEICSRNNLILVKNIGKATFAALHFPGNLKEVMEKLPNSVAFMLSESLNVLLSVIGEEYVTLALLANSLNKVVKEGANEENINEVTYVLLKHVYPLVLGLLFGEFAKAKRIEHTQRMEILKGRIARYEMLVEELKKKYKAISPKILPELRFSEENKTVMILAPSEIVTEDTEVAEAVENIRKLKTLRITSSLSYALMLQHLQPNVCETALNVAVSSGIITEEERNEIHEVYEALKEGEALCEVIEKVKEIKEGTELLKKGKTGEVVKVKTKTPKGEETIEYVVPSPEKLEKLRKEAKELFKSIDMRKAIFGYILLKRMMSEEKVMAELREVEEVLGIKHPLINREVIRSVLPKAEEIRANHEHELMKFLKKEVRKV